MEDAVLDGIQQQFANATGGWFETIFPYAQKLFFALVVIELTWAAILWVLDRDDPSSVIGSLLKKVVAVGLFYAILLNADVWIPAVLNSFIGIGAAASGLAELTPSGVLSQGIDLAAKMLEPLGLLGFLSATIASIIGGLAALGVVFAFGIIAAQLLLTNVESYIVVGGGVLLLGFAGSRWTADIASRYLSYAVAIGIKLFSLYLIIGIGNSLAGQWGELLLLPEATLNPRVYFQILGGALAYMMLAWYIPSLAASLYTGTVALSLAELAYMGRSVGAAASSVGVGALATTGAVVGGSQAVMEAARFGREAAIAAGGGYGSFPTAAAGAAGVLAREGIRAAIPTLVPRGNSTADRIAERRAIQTPALHGYAIAEATPTPKPNLSEPPSAVVGSEESGVAEDGRTGEEGSQPRSERM